MAKHKHTDEQSPAPEEQSVPVETTAVSTPKSVPEKATLQSKHAAFLTKLTEKNITLRSETFNSLGLSVVIPVAGSIEDFDALAGKSGEALNQANKNIVYRGALAIFRDELCTRVAERTGIERPIEYAKNADGTDKIVDGEKVFVKYTESEARYIKRVAGDNPEQFQDIATEISQYLVFDPSETEPKVSGPKTIAKVYTTTAQQLFDQGKGEAVIEKLAAKLGVTPISNDVAGLAALIKEDQSRKKLTDEYSA